MRVRARKGGLSLSYHGYVHDAPTKIGLLVRSKKRNSETKKYSRKEKKERYPMWKKPLPRASFRIKKSYQPFWNEFPLFAYFWLIFMHIWWFWWSLNQNGTFLNVDQGSSEVTFLLESRFWGSKSEKCEYLLSDAEWGQMDGAYPRRKFSPRPKYSIYHYRDSPRSRYTLDREHFFEIPKKRKNKI